MKYLADENGHWIPEEEWLLQKYNTPMVMGDIKPYQSMIDGSWITSRSQHREHLRMHGCREIGNETAALLRSYDNIPDVAPQQRHELIRAQVNAMSHDEFKRALKRDVDRVKWNSRED